MRAACSSGVLTTIAVPAPIWNGGVARGSTVAGCGIKFRTSGGFMTPGGTVPGAGCAAAAGGGWGAFDGGIRAHAASVSPRHSHAPQPAVCNRQSAIVIYPLGYTRLNDRPSRLPGHGVFRASARPFHPVLHGD